MKTITTITLSTLLIVSLFSIYKYKEYHNSQDSNNQSEDPETITINMPQSGVDTTYFEGLMDHLVDQNPKSKTATRLILNFQNNRIANIDGLKRVTELQQLKFLEINMSSNQITDISSLLYFANLYHVEHLKLDLSQNQVTDLSTFNFLGSIQILRNVEISLSGNQIPTSGLAIFQRGVMQLNPKRIQTFNILIQNTKIDQSVLQEMNRVGKIYYGNQFDMKI